MNIPCKRQISCDCDPIPGTNYSSEYEDRWLELEDAYGFWTFPDIHYPVVPEVLSVCCCDLTQLNQYSLARGLCSIHQAENIFLRIGGSSVE